jgi:ATP-dependent helicase/nuclease subunit A
MNIAITSAGAGTGKTYHLCSIITKALTTTNPTEKCRPGAFIATTFTTKAAAELKERIQSRLLDEGHHAEAMRVGEALIGTVHSVCGRILERFAFDAGISPRLRILDEALEKILLSQAIEQCAKLDEISEMERLCRTLGQTNTQTFESNWRDHVRDVISAARSNSIFPDQLPAMADQSIQEMLGMLPAALPNEPDSILQSAIEQAISEIRGNGDATKTTATCLGVLEQALADLRSGHLKWSDWCKLAKLSAAKASQGALEPVHEAAANYDQHPELHAEIQRYIEQIFHFAREAMESYQERKKARGALDYTDLETLTLSLLDREEVQACIRQEFDLMVVDEFQDTSPIQLALFLKLAGLIRRSEWVGDTKQAIYGFRGCDPTLMQTAAAKFTKTGTLAESRRHRPQLVDFYNALFPGVFAKTHPKMPVSEIELAAYREEQSGMPPAIELWSMASNRSTKSGASAAIKVSEADACIVQGVNELKTSGVLVSDRAQQRDKAEVLRPVRWGDIAILCATNKRASAIAAGLISVGIPAARETAGLLSTPEAVLALACLRWLNDSNDSVATAEILSLEACRSIEEWLEDRFEWLVAPEGRWGLDGKIKSRVLERILPLRDRMLLLTPAELLDAALVGADLPGIVSQWNAESAAHRRSNLEALRGLVREYEAGCDSSTSAASHAGFLIWCSSLASAEEDKSAFDATADAVQVMTWHGSKGLEWPVVICLDAHKEPRSRLWNSPVVVAAAHFDPDQPLADRRIRFWPNPFGKQSKGVEFLATAESSAVGSNAVEESEAEQSRLQYVAMTRARDQLILPQDGKSSPWLPQDVVCPVFNSMAVDSSEDEVLGIRRRSRRLSPDSSIPEVAPASSVACFPEPLTPKEFPAAELSPSAIETTGEEIAGEIVSYGERIAFGARCSDAELGNALHAILALAFINKEALALKSADILQAHGVDADASAVEESVRSFLDWIQTTFQPVEALVEVPFTHWNTAGQRIAGNMDLVLILKNGEAVLIDHKSYQGPDLQTHAASHTGQIAAYRDALAANGHPIHSAWIHFCTQGKLIKIR